MPSGCDILAAMRTRASALLHGLPSFRGLSCAPVCQMRLPGENWIYVVVLVTRSRPTVSQTSHANPRMIAYAGHHIHELSRAGFSGGSELTRRR